VIVLANEATAFQAYRLLHYHGISPENLAIVGKGYSSPERVGLLSPGQIIRRIAWRFTLLAAALGLVVGTSMSLTLNFEPAKLAVAIPLASFISSICGAIVGTLFGLLGDGSTASIYRHHLNQGRYLLMIEGPENLVRWGQEVLGHYSAHV
jgi:hypothetical protein